MPRQAKGLTAAKVKTASAGRYGDGNGLYLVVGTGDARSWVFRWVRPDQTGKPRMREMGIGPAAGGSAAVSLADARQRAGELIKDVRAGIDPLAARAARTAAEAAARQIAAVKAITFRNVADRYVDAHEAGWAAKTRTGWVSTLATYAHPKFGDIPVADIDTGQVMTALDPVWRVKPETAGRLRFRVEAVLDYAKVNGWRSGENPARWRGHLDKLLPAQSAVAAVEHHAALPYRDMHEFMLALRKQLGVSARALEFAILTVSRTNEALGGSWREIDSAARVWTIPASRMKGGKEHRIHLTDRAVEILEEMRKIRASNKPDAPLFPGAKPGKPLSNMALLMVLRRMKRGDLTSHGFRSTFKDWAAERTNFPGELSEMALAHTIGDKVEAAYRRGDMFDKRRKLADAWADFCNTPWRDGATVTPIRKAEA